MTPDEVMTAVLVVSAIISIWSLWIFYRSLHAPPTVDPLADLDRIATALEAMVQQLQQQAQQSPPPPPSAAPSASTLAPAPAPMAPPPPPQQQQQQQQPLQLPQPPSATTRRTGAARTARTRPPWLA